MTQDLRKKNQALRCPHCFRELHGESDLKIEIGSVLFALKQAVKEGIINIKLVKNRRKT